jgi:hypothetical protein
MNKPEIVVVTGASAGLGRGRRRVGGSSPAPRTLRRLGDGEGDCRRQDCPPARGLVSRADRLSGAANERSGGCLPPAQLVGTCAGGSRGARRL